MKLLFPALFILLQGCNPSPPTPPDRRREYDSVVIAKLQTDLSQIRLELDTIKLRMAARDEWIQYADSVISDRQWRRDRAGRRGEFLGNLGVAIGVVKRVK